MDSIEVKTVEGQVFTISLQHAKRCETIRDLLESGWASEDGTFPLPSNVNEKNFKKVMDWYAFAPAPLKQEKEETVKKTLILQKTFEPTSEQEEYLKDMTPLEISALMSVANSLAAKDLLDYLANFTAFRIILGKTPQEIAKAYGVNPELVSDEAIQDALDNDPDLAFLKEEK